MKRLSVTEGDIFEYFTVISRAKKVIGCGHRYASCKCKCGVIKDIRIDHLISGRTKSCGCYNLQKAITHGMSATRVYKSWFSMCSRCNNKSDPSYKHYGGRGISVCKEWVNDVKVFYKDMGERPQKTTIDRIDVNGNYCKENCRWSTVVVQNNNRRDNCYITYKKEKLTIEQWSRKMKISGQNIRYRLRAGWSIKDTLTKKKQNYNRQPS